MKGLETLTPKGMFETPKGFFKKEIFLKGTQKNGKNMEKRALGN